MLVTLPLQDDPASQMWAAHRAARNSELYQWKGGHLWWAVRAKTIVDKLLASRISKEALVPFQKTASQVVEFVSEVTLTLEFKCSRNSYQRP